MKKSGGKAAQPYGWPAPFERAVAYLACVDPRFMARTAHEVQPELIDSAECKDAVDAAQSIFRRTGRGPSSPAIVIQEVASRREAGKATHEQVKAVAGLFDAYDGGKAPVMDEVEAQVVATIRKRLRFSIAQTAIDEHNEEEWSRLHDLIRREERLGKSEEAASVVMSSGGIKQALAGLRGIKRVPLGIDVLDEVLRGGVPNGTLTCFMGGPGGGKSMAMSHSAAMQSMAGRFGAVATLEVPSPYVIARILACQTGVPINDILESPEAEDLALSRLVGTTWCPPVVRDFAPHVTTVEHITEWAEEVEQQEGRKLEYLIVDYADKLTASGKVDEKGMYQEMRVVFEKLRIYVDHRKILGVTASQSRARDEKKSKHIDLEHVADSMHKARIVDQFITLNYDDDTQEMLFFLAKNRYGEGRREVGPVPATFGLGQVAPVERMPVDRARAIATQAFTTASATATRLGASPGAAYVAGVEAAEREVGADDEEPSQPAPAAPPDDEEAPF